MLISIIVPVYNVEQYLERCVDSILAQTFTDYEMILVDDGSTDNGGRLCDRLAEKDRRIHVIHKKNGGLSDARNAGLDYATGKYVVFIDSDDYVEPELLEKAYNKIEEGYDLVTFGFNEISSDGTVARKVPLEARNEQRFDNHDDYMNYLIRSYLHFGVWMPVWLKIYRRDIIESKKIRFSDTKKVCAEDICFELCYDACIKRIYTMDDCLYNYCRREDSLMEDVVKQCNLNRYDNLAKEVFKFYSSHDELTFLTERFSVIYFFLLHYEMRNYYKKRIFSDIELKEIFDKEIADKQFMRTQFKRLRRYKEYLMLEFSKIHTYELLNNIEYALDGNMFKSKLKNKLLFKFYK